MGLFLETVSWSERELKMWVRGNELRGTRPEFWFWGIFVLFLFCCCLFVFVFCCT